MGKSGILFLFVALSLGFSHFSCKHKEKSHKPSASPTRSSQKNTDISKGRSKADAEEHWYLKIGATKKQVHENKLYSFINDWYGTPYKYSGCSKSGVDCSCFTNVCYETVFDRKIARSANEMFMSCDKIELRQAQEGDLVFFKIGGNKISHVGIFLKKNFFVHASTSSGVTINSLDEAYYKKYFFCAGKMKSV